MFLVWKPGTWGEPMFASEHRFTSFPFLLVDVRNGQYRATRTDGTGLGSTSGNEGWSSGGSCWFEGSCRWGAGSSAQAFLPLGSHSTKDRGWNERKLLDRTEGVLGDGNPMVPVSLVGMDRGYLPVVPQVSGARRRGRGMRPAGGNRPFPRRVKNELTDEEGNTVVRPLSVEAEEFSLGSGLKDRVTAGAGSDGSRHFLPSHTGPGGIVTRCGAVVLTAAEAGAVALADIAGAVAPVDLAGTNVLAVAGRKFSAVAEVHSSAVDDEGDPSVVRTSRQRSAVNLEPMVAPRKDGGPMEEISVLEPLEHSLLEVSLEGVIVR